VRNLTLPDVVGQPLRLPGWQAQRLPYNSVMLSEALQRNAKHEARLSNISGCCLSREKISEIESLASPASSAALLRSAQNDN
jgi:hypothetical protein